MRAQIAALEKRSEVHNQHTVRHTLQKISGSLVGPDYILEARAHREKHGAGG